MARKQKPEAEDFKGATVDEVDSILTLTTKTLAGDLRDFLLDRLKHDHNPLPWNVRPEKDQEATIERATAAAERIVTRAVEMIAADGRKVIRATLVKVAIKDVIQGVVELSKSDAQRHDLIDSTGSEVMIVVSDASAYMGQRGKVEIVKDQASLLPSAEEERKRDLEDIEAAGFKVGESGGKSTDQKWTPGTDFYAAWMKGYEDGVAFRKESDPDAEAP